jgi:hypothetical protein
MWTCLQHHAYWSIFNKLPWRFILPSRTTGARGVKKKGEYGHKSENVENRCRSTTVDRTGWNSSHRPRHTVQAARRRFLTADTRVQYRMPLSGTRGEQSGSGLSFSLKLLIRAWGKREDSEKNLCQCHSVHRKSYMDWLGREPFKAER